MNSNSLEFIVEVDGQPIAPAAFEFHFQDEAFPAGHEFKLTINENDVVKEAIIRFGLGVHSQLGRELVAPFFSLLRSFISFKCGRKSALFWGNTIRRIEVCDDRCVIFGQCSPPAPDLLKEA